MESRYDHRQIEEKWYSIWEERGLFRPEYGKAEEKKGKKGKPYCIVIPPPNITGQLHVGHALNHTIQDVLIRTARKRGLNTLWLPGTDHAGIATQNRVEKNLRSEGKSRLDLGREKFVKTIWKWKEHSGGLITRQIRKLGLSVDWSRERFTMDDGLSAAVRRVFVRLFDEGLIFRGERIINWCPSESCTTALANDEVEHVDREGKLWHIRYPFADGKGHITVATTRPETMLGDTAVAVHPADERYLDHHGRTILLPLLDREIPLILDDAVERDFGSGAVKVTPAHDPNDFEMGRRHRLPSVLIMDEHARINEHGGPYAGMDRYAAREKIVADLEAKGLLEKAEKHFHAVGTCYRCNQVIEPIQSLQWFVRTRPLAEKAIAAVQNGSIRFFPKRWENLYFDWMNNIQDWCISRQLWWGHRIPVYYCDSCGEIIAAEKKPETCRKCNSAELHQDSDVLDTWFSSALWPFSTLGWPEKTEDLKAFYPGSVLVTAFDIIFFWVARMIMMGLHVMGEVPFRHVYIHGLMRDEKGRKISKSLGNNIDPLDVIKEYGTDAYRFFLMATLSEGKDSVYSEKRLKGYQNFANKIWNSTRFVLMNLPDDFRPQPTDLKKFKLEEEDWWILKKLNETIELMESSIEVYRFHIAAEAVYTCVWNHFCDWYIELIKPRMFEKGSAESTAAARQTAFYVLGALLDLMHPFMPFITEELYEYLRRFRKPENDREEYLITSPWPEKISPDKRALQATEGLELVQEVIQVARVIRGETNIPPDKKVKLIVRSDSRALAAILQAKEAAVLRLSQASTITVVDEYRAGKFDATGAFSRGEVFLPLEGLLDIEKEIARLRGDLSKCEKQRIGIQKKLDNSGFLEKAPEEVVDQEREKLNQLEEKMKVLGDSLKRFRIH